MKTIKGTYYNGRLKLDKPVKHKKPVRVTVTFEEEEPKKRLRLEDFSFKRSQKELEDYKGTLSDDVVAERREEL